MPCKKDQLTWSK